MNHDLQYCTQESITRQITLQEAEKRKPRTAGDKDVESISERRDQPCIAKPLAVLCQKIKIARKCSNNVQGYGSVWGIIC